MKKIIILLIFVFSISTYGLDKYFKIGTTYSVIYISDKYLGDREFGIPEDGNPEDYSKYKFGWSFGVGLKGYIWDNLFLGVEFLYNQKGMEFKKGEVSDDFYEFDISYLDSIIYMGYTYKQFSPYFGFSKDTFLQFNVHNTTHALFKDSYFDSSYSILFGVEYSWKYLIVDFRFSHGLTNIGQIDPDNGEGDIYDSLQKSKQFLLMIGVKF